jgi:hypothetical protein
MSRKSAFGFRKCRLRSEATASLRSQTGLYRSDRLAVSRPAKHGEEHAYEVADDVPDIVPVTQKEISRHIWQRLLRKGLI